MSENESISIRKLSDETDRDFSVKHVTSPEQWEELQGYSIHRDDCYLLVVLENGVGEMEIDFQKVSMSAPRLCIVRPGQVHYNIDGNCPDCWVVLIDAALMPAEYATALDDALLYRQDFALSGRQLAEITSILGMISAELKETETPSFRGKLLAAMLDVFICRAVAVACTSVEAPDRKTGRTHEICNHFRKLLSKSRSGIMTPSDCAGQMCLSTSYLNEVVKKATGNSVSFWIRDHKMLEAKRQLCFTTKSVKEIAFSIGFDDHIYFSKLFRSHVGMPPGEFRAKYRE